MSSTEPSSSSTSPLSVAPTTSVTNNSPDAVLGKDDFLKLLVDQLKNQDPTSPTDSSTFMAQLAQFSSLEQQTNMSETLTGLASTDAVTQGVDLIGRNLTFTRSDGSSGTGVADAITVAGGSVVIDVDGENVDPADVTGVGQAPSTTPSSGS
ncbi:MAG TPA: flagellar hook capping FlgD N-terminal domain-containing protein [Gaiellaceae bacterium]|jgi:flagellar basal-body rod modification protein FlgD|nr:flagellar hook capping FlgD N-terminal domain-containing protein [Gaiellaceae bacterium]